MHDLACWGEGWLTREGAREATSSFYTSIYSHDSEKAACKLGAGRSARARTHTAP